uniref:Uncharacterized protein n=1 Tax=Oryza punctata TaxID=4537 RepID=A0A0E0ME68_ORYPU
MASLLIAIATKNSIDFTISTSTISVITDYIRDAAEVLIPSGHSPGRCSGVQPRPDGSSFEVYLTGDCKFCAAKEYMLHYSSRIADNVSVFAPSLHWRE